MILFVLLHVLDFLALAQAAPANCTERCERLHVRSLHRIGHTVESAYQLIDKQKPAGTLKAACWRSFDYLDCMRKCDPPREFEKKAAHVRKKCRIVMKDMERGLACVSRYHSFMEVRCSSFLKEAVQRRKQGDLKSTPDADTCRYLHLNAMCLENSVPAYCPAAKTYFTRLSLRDYFLSFVLPDEDELFDDVDLDECQFLDFVGEALEETTTVVVDWDAANSPTETITSKPGALRMVEGEGEGTEGAEGTETTTQAAKITKSTRRIRSTTLQMGEKSNFVYTPEGTSPSSKEKTAPPPSTAPPSTAPPFTSPPSTSLPSTSSPPPAPTAAAQVIPTTLVYRKYLEAINAYTTHAPERSARASTVKVLPRSEEEDVFAGIDIDKIFEEDEEMVKKDDTKSDGTASVLVAPKNAKEQKKEKEEQKEEEQASSEAAGQLLMLQPADETEETNSTVSPPPPSTLSPSEREKMRQELEMITSTRLDGVVFKSELDARTGVRHRDDIRETSEEAKFTTRSVVVTVTAESPFSWDEEDSEEAGHEGAESDEEDAAVHIVPIMTRRPKMLDPSSGEQTSGTLVGGGVVVKPIRGWDEAAHGHEEGDDRDPDYAYDEGPVGVAEQPTEAATPSAGEGLARYAVDQPLLLAIYCSLFMVAVVSFLCLMICCFAKSKSRYRTYRVERDAKKSLHREEEEA